MKIYSHISGCIVLIFSNLNPKRGLLLKNMDKNAHRYYYDYNHHDYVIDDDWSINDPYQKEFWELIYDCESKH